MNLPLAKLAPLCVLVSVAGTLILSKEMNGSGSHKAKKVIIGRKRTVLVIELVCIYNQELFHGQLYLG